MATNNSWNSSKPVQVSFGGTGVATIPSNTVPYGNGTGALLNTSVGTNGQLLIGATSAPPAFATVTSTGGTVTITPGVNSLNLEVNSMAQGTWTPALTFGGGTTGITYATQAGYYVRVGNCINYVINITLTNKGSSTGNLGITGFPVAAGSADLSYPTANIFINNANTLLLPANLVGAFKTNVLTINSFSLTTALNTIVTNVLFNNNTVINIVGSYMVGF